VAKLFTRSLLTQPHWDPSLFPLVSSLHLTCAYSLRREYISSLGVMDASAAVENDEEASIAAARAFSKSIPP